MKKLKTEQYRNTVKEEVNQMGDMLVLSIYVSRGTNIMRNPLLVAHGMADIKGQKREISVETPITSVKDFVEAFEGLFREEG